MLRALTHCQWAPRWSGSMAFRLGVQRPLPVAATTAALRQGGDSIAAPGFSGTLARHARQLSGRGGGSQWRPRRHNERPSPQVVRAMRDLSDVRDPQQQQRRERLEPGHHHFYATCHPGLEAVVAAELEAATIGAANVHPGKAGVSFTGTLSAGYRANLWLRSAIRVLQLLHETDMDPQRASGDEVYSAFREGAAWERLLAPGQSFSVDSRVWSCSNLSSSQLLSVRAKDAICDAIRDVRGSKPLPPESGRVADVPLFCTAYHDRLTLYRDMSGASLHRRGYRQAMHRASLNEAAAAGILYMTGWHEMCRQEGAVLADPMCGSGTFLIEAALMATDVAPGSFRRWWPFTQWPDFEPATWEQAVAEANAGRHTPPPGVEVWGNDVHPAALSLALKDVQAAGMGRMVRLHHGECKDWALPRPPAVVVSNPPWGQRLAGGGRGGVGEEITGGSSGLFSGSVGEEEGRLNWWDEEAPPEQQAAAQAAQMQQRRGRQEQQRETAALEATWWDLSAFLKRQCAGANGFLLSGNPEATKGLRMKATRRHPLTVGGVDCRLLEYSIRGMDPTPAGGPAVTGREAVAGGAAAGGAAQRDSVF